ncbi:MAG: PqqD family protein [Clostridiales bacterium]|nr:PqqD family protein [Clostridiales bacterium]
MELKKQFILREIVGEAVLVPIGESATRFNGLITINELGKFIWENIEKVENEEKLLQLILNEYEVNEDTAKKDLDEFLQVLKDMDIV